MYLLQSLRRAATINPSGTATIFRDRKRSWAETADRIGRVAGGLAGLGIVKGDRIAILALNSDLFFETLLAVPAADAIIVPINTRLAPPEIAYILRDSGCKLIFVDDAFTALLAQVAGINELQLICLGDGYTPAGTLSYASLLDSEPAASGTAAGDDVAGIFYTGGTTGQSKGVMVTHRNLVSNAAMVIPAFGYNVDSIYIHAAPMFHLADGMSTFAITMVGGTHVFIPRFDPVDLLTEISRNRVTNTALVPTMINAMVNFSGLGNFDISSLRLIVFGASPMPEALFQKAAATLPGVHFLQVYGMTEASPLVTAMDLYAEPVGVRIQSCGRPTLLMDLRIADANDNEAPRGTVGEVQARGPNIMLGYWNQPDATKAALRGGWYRTGDGGIMDADGYVFIVDRLKDMIISGGENVYSAEVENAIASLGAVAEVAVIGVPDEHWGEAVHAVVVPRAGHTLTAEQVINHSRALIAHFKCPRSVEIRTLTLPLSAVGKVLKTQLREPFWAGYDKRIR